VRILYLHMIGAFGGASRSLIEVVRALPKEEVEVLFVTPRGSAANAFRRIASDVIEVRGMSQFDNTRYSFYRGLRWLVLLREIFYLPFTIAGLVRARLRWGSVDLIHVNEFTGLIPWLLARKLFSAPVVVHVRSLARVNKSSPITRWINYLLRNKADAVIAIDENVRASLPSDLSVSVIHNSFSPGYKKKDNNLQKTIQKIRKESFKVGFVGNLLRVKGLFELIEAAHILDQEGLDIEYLIVGDDAHRRSSLFKWLLRNLGLSQDVKKEILSMISQYGLANRFHFSGFTADIQSAYTAVDVLCFPSHYDAPGRPVFEAAFVGVPSIVAVREPHPDTLINGHTGLAIFPQDFIGLASAIRSLATNRDWCQSLGQSARDLAHNNFDVVKNSKLLLELYRNCIVGSKIPFKIS
jgi:glycosyltransferase involved in cell wall biosynthesis